MLCTQKVKRRAQNKNSFLNVVFSFFIVLPFFISTSIAAPPSIQAPDAGSVLKQIEQKSNIKPLPPPEPSEINEEAPLLKEGEKVKIIEFQFRNNKIISSEELKKHLNKYVGRELTFNELKLAVASISILYKEIGFLAQATLPPQDITSGVIQIDILEATFGKTQYLTDNEKPHVNPDRIMNIIYPPSKENEPLDLNRLERGILLANDLPGAGAGVQLMAGDKPGSTDIGVKIQNKKRFQGSFIVDNFGSRMTGRDRALFNVSIRSPFGWADSIGLTSLKTEGTTYVRTSYLLPVGNNGLRLGVNATYLEYKVVAKEFEVAKVFGYSGGVGALATYPLYRSRTKNLNAEVSYDVKRFINKNLSGTQSDYYTRIYTAAFPFDFTDQLMFEGASNDGRLSLMHGKNEGLSDSSVEGYFNIAQINFKRQQFFKNNFGLNFTLIAQKTDHNLDSSQKMYLGGPNGVRAYPTSEAGGSEGYQYSLELQKFLPNNLTLSGFYDEGYVRQLNEGTPTVGPNSYRLKGYGISLHWDGPMQTSFDATWARRDGSNPNKTPSGMDQSGKLIEDVFWLKAAVNF